MRKPRKADRRTVVKALGAGAVGSVALTTSASAAENQDKANGYGNGNGIGAFLNEDAVWNDNPWGTGITNRTGESEVEVLVGTPVTINPPFTPGEVEGPFGFTPQAVKVSPGTEVTWKWVAAHHSVTSYNESAGDPPDPTSTGGHGVLFDEHAEPPHSLSHTFEGAGTYLYFCHPHGTPYPAYDPFLEEEGLDPVRENLLGMRGAVIVAGN